jgi:two-component system phosphate regulon sensor histidine kinase PhoR
LLYLARLEGQSIETMAQNRHKIRLDQLIEDLVNEYKSYPQGRNIKWNVNIQLKDAFTMGSPEELKRAIGNVIDNAIKYTSRKYGEKEGGIISVSLSDGGRWWRISVSDNGVGISPDIVLNIFDRFKRSSTDKIRRKGEMTGFGLGLAIAKNIIEAHNGLIEVTSAREPTTFTINLPKMKE